MRMLLLALSAVSLLTAQDYNGPLPAKPDVLYLLHAATLIETPGAEAKQETKKGDTTYWVEGTAATVKTPLAEPIFILQANKLNPDKIELYRFTVTKTRRELTIKERPGRNDPKPLHLIVTKLGKDLYKVEVSEQLANGEYSLSPSGSNQVFSFSVF
jgi:hypothetical protein